MKRRHLVTSFTTSLLCAALTRPASAQSANGEAERVALAGTQRLQVRGGPAGDRVYELLISLPAGKTMPARGHRVLFMLDGNAHFGAFHDARRAQTEFAEAMVVAVGYPTAGTHDFLRRSYDFSPPAPEGSEPPQGGDEEFLDTLEKAIIPAVERHWRIERASMGLFGHSFGAMFALRALFTRPLLFTHYVAASPSLWWRDDYLLAPERAFAAQLEQGRINAAHHSVLLIVGDRETPQEIQDARALQRRLAPLSRHGLRSAFVLQPGEDHMSLPIAIAPQVMRQVFKARRI